MGQGGTIGLQIRPGTHKQHAEPFRSIKYQLMICLKISIHRTSIYWKLTEIIQRLEVALEITPWCVAIVGLPSLKMRNGQRTTYSAEFVPPISFNYMSGIKYKNNN